MYIEWQTVISAGAAVSVLLLMLGIMAKLKLDKYLNQQAHE